MNSRESSEEEYVDEALLFDTRNFEVEIMQKMSIVRYKHQAVEC